MMRVPVSTLESFTFFLLADLFGRFSRSWNLRYVLLYLGIAASSMGSLSQVWSQEKLSLHTKLQVYMTCIVPVFVDGSESWTLLSSDISHLEAFHMRCQRWILRVRWQDMVRDTAIVGKTGLQSVSAIIDTRRTAQFGHVARLDDHVPTCCTLHLAIDVMPP